ncbi:MAG: hypothetical protein R3242_05065 [Akkermansiaceae bacterium]|nr:hypothetical protein [Akkermansiaceae bacterium]
MQSFLTTIAKLMDEQELPALMIGGHAVTALGHPRATFDLDLLIPRSSAPRWGKAMAGMRYRLFAESANFHQYEAPDALPLPPVDLMLVDDEVFATLEQSKSSIEPIATPGVMALIALKLHAIHQDAREERAKDWSDVLALIKAHRLTLDDPEFAATVRKHGGQTAIERIQASLSGGA